MTHFNWKEYSNVADKLSESKDNEAFLRAAISRYYYSVFGSARYYLVEKKSETRFLKRHRIHTMVYEELKKSTDDNEAELGELLQTLSEIRKLADYDWENTGLSHFQKQLPIVQAKVEKAFEDINALNSYPSNFKF